MDNLTINPRIAVTGFMGVGKSTVSRHLAGIVDTQWIDLDTKIEKTHGRSITEIVSDKGIHVFRAYESDALACVLQDSEIAIISLGGGAFTIAANSTVLKASNVTSIWLEASFDHCWANIRNSHKDRPLLINRKQAESLYQERIKSYCLADWHFVIRPGCNSYGVAERIAEEVFGVRKDDEHVV